MPQIVLLSIRPEFAEKILDGRKRFEFRRTIFRDTNVTKAIIYASRPVCRVIGEFEIEEVLSLPMYPELSEEQIETVVEVITDFCKGAG